MRHPAESQRTSAGARGALLVLTLLAGGCTTLEQWVHNGFKLGPSFQPPPAKVTSQWIDSADPHLARASVDGIAWWNVLGDPALNRLIDTALQQNLDLKTSATRIFEAKAQRNIAAGNLFPQSQGAIGAYAHVQNSKNSALLGGLTGPAAGLGGFPASFGAIPSNFDLWATGFNVSWELDFWGHIRRNIESNNASLDASVEGYRAALVTLQAEVANNYVQIRTFQQRIAYARHNVEIQTGSLRIAEARLKEGRATALDVEQARSNLAQTQASIPPLEIGLRQASNRLCVLLGEAPHALAACLTPAPIPTTPPEVAVGIPAELLQRRPDVRQALAQAAAQCAQIGVAEADFYPRIGVLGFLGYTADDIRRLFTESSYTGIIVPNVQWKILNYGRILNNVRYQDALFKEKVLTYQQTVLTAGREVEDALVGFLQSQLQARSLETSVRAAERSVELTLEQYKEGRVDYNRVFTTQAQLTTQQDALATAQGNIALNLIGVYRALGGGWQVAEGTTVPCGPPVKFLAPVPAE